MSPNNTRCGANGDGYGVGDVNYIVHRVSKMDTLAGIAIKYGVEVTDIKRMNGLATDIQMFALKSLQIPLPGRHPPSLISSNGSASPSPSSSPSPPFLRGSHIEKTPPRIGHSQRLKSPQQKFSPAMNKLQDYYDLRSSNTEHLAEEMEMAVYRTSKSDQFDYGLLAKVSPISDSSSKCLHKSGHSANGFFSENGATFKDVHLAEGKNARDEAFNDYSVQWQQKAETDSECDTPERLLKEENGNGSGGFSAVTGYGLSLRPKSAGRSTLVSDAESGCLGSTPLSFADPLTADGVGLAGVRKSLSTSSLQDKDGNNTSSMWLPSRWSLKPDLQVLSTASIVKPIFDGLPKPITGRRNKAALD